jgi:serine/threonine protein kinase
MRPIGITGNTIKIFDFGLCRELPEARPESNKAFHMSGVGTRRYMAPEVFLGQYYNLKADVYSWTIVLYAMLSLQKPFENYNTALHRLLIRVSSIESYRLLPCISVILLGAEASNNR